LPADETGVAVSAKTGKKINAVSPLSPVEPWGKLGRKWTDNPGCRKMQEIYPDPPLIIFVSNNEAHDFRWYNAEKEKRYLELYGEGRSDEFKRRVFADGWVVRYAELIRGMRSGLVNSNWKGKSLFVAYNAIGPDHFGRPDLAPEGGWKKYSTASENRLDWQPYAWEGAIPESYDNHWEPEKTAWRVWSMQTEMMNLWFMKRDAMNLNASFWMEVIFWDGNLPSKDNDKYKRYRELGYEYTPERYRGWVQYNMWNLRPRVAREWRASNDDKDRWWDYFLQIIQSVDRVHQDDTLKKFWRHGEIVVNEEGEHPFDADLPERWQDEPRWFHLPTSTDPAPPWQLDTKIPVYTLALKIGEEGAREWLLYAHAPMDPQKGVEVTIPDYGKVKLDEVPIGGAFWHLNEKDKTIRSIGD
jgi:hypothetical protein